MVAGTKLQIYLQWTHHLKIKKQSVGVWLLSGYFTIRQKNLLVSGTCLITLLSRRSKSIGIWYCLSWSYNNDYDIDRHNSRPFIVSSMCCTPSPTSLLMWQRNNPEFVGCLTSHKHSSVSQRLNCSDTFTHLHAEKEDADQTFHLI